MVATPQPDDLGSRIKRIAGQLDVLTRTRYSQYQPIPLLAVATNNDYSNTTTTAKLLAVGGYTFNSAIPVIHVGWHCTFTASTAATASVTVTALDQATSATTTVITATPQVLTAPASSGGTFAGFFDTSYTVPATFVGHTVMLQCYTQMVSGTGTVVAYPVSAREAAS